MSASASARTRGSVTTTRTVVPIAANVVLAGAGAVVVGTAGRAQEPCVVDWVDEPEPEETVPDEANPFVDGLFAEEPSTRSRSRRVARARARRGPRRPARGDPLAVVADCAVASWYPLTPVARAAATTAPAVQFLAVWRARGVLRMGITFGGLETC